MSEKTETVYWNGEIVGVVSNPKVDNFDYYGAWEPTGDDELYQRFLAQVDQDGGARVDLGQVGSPLSGTVELEPEDEIEIKIRP